MLQSRDNRYLQEEETDDHHILHRGIQSKELTQCLNIASILLYSLFSYFVLRDPLGDFKQKRTVNRLVLPTHD